MTFSPLPVSLRALGEIKKANKSFDKISNGMLAKKGGAGYKKLDD